jgi:hypothetical protein
VKPGTDVPALPMLRRGLQMSAKLRQYLLDAYSGNREILPEKIGKDFPIQIDDQDDDDPISDFCNIFVVVKKNNRFEIELFGCIPFSKEIADLAEIYGGFADEAVSKIILNLSVRQIDSLIDLSKKIRKTVAFTHATHNHNGHGTAARTISSLYRFVRIVKEYVRSKAGLV